MRHQRTLFLSSILLIVAALTLGISLPRTTVEAAGAGSRDLGLYARPAPKYDLNLARNLKNARKATQDQLNAIESLKSSTGASSMAVRWNDFGGSPDVIMDFAGPASSGTPAESARAFLSANSAVFGISNLDDLKLVSEKSALGGHLLRFQQSFNGIEVKNGGVGLVLNANNQVIMASGPFFRDVNVNTTPNLSAADAVRAVDADLAKFYKSLPQSVTDLLRPGLERISSQLTEVQKIEPKLGIYPTVDGYRLVWKVAKYSTNPFGLYAVSVDAHTGEIVSRDDYALFFQTPSAQPPLTADIYPKYPTITQELKDQGKISVDPATQTPLGQERVKLRKFDMNNLASGLEGTLTGQHALVNNALATKQPFAQAAKGTWHFRIDDPTNFEARTNEQDQFAEPAEHQDEINAFFFVTYLLEYVDYLHVAGDSVHSRVGQGDFPDDYPSKAVPLPATVHAPNIYFALGVLGGTVPTVDTNLPFIVLGLDNAVAFNLTGLIREITGTQTPVSANPTIYGHGYLLNDLALEGTVPYHEGMHAITTPIAGLEGTTEGSALNEGQADMWAFTITDNPSLGDYVVNAKDYRQRFRDRGRDPDSIAYIRSARSTLKYSDFGTLFNSATGQYELEEHRDGEIYMSTMWDLREMLNRTEPSLIYNRPRPKDGEALKQITTGTDTFERLFLGSMYILGTTSPDTFLKARDALLVADQSLYSSDPTNPAAPGIHRAMIEQIFAAHEMGVNAKEVAGTTATISTQVSSFAGNQPAPAAPQGVKVEPASVKTLKVSWQPVQGAAAYEVLKRKKGFENKREPNGKREYLDGDASTTGFRHVAFVDGSASSFEDKGKVEEVFAPAGLPNLFDHEYVVRAIGVNSSKQVGFSPLSGSATPTVVEQNLTAAIDTAISNVSFSNGVFAFDQTLTNARGANSTDKTIYSPIEFRITSISDPSVTVKNADQASPSPMFVYNNVLPLGAVSGARRLEFNDPMAKLFTFDANIIGRAFAGSTVGTGSQSGDGTNDPQPVTYSLFKQEFTGNIPLGDPTGLTNGAGTLQDSAELALDADPTFMGITYVDIEIEAKSDALFLEANLSSLTAVDLDLELLSADKKTRLARSASASANEQIQFNIQPGTRYVLRIVGFIGAGSDYKLVATQRLPQGSPNENAGTITVSPSGTSGSSGTQPLLGTVKTVRFTVNPLTRKVTAQLLK